MILFSDAKTIYHYYRASDKSYLQFKVNLNRLHSCFYTFNGLPPFNNLESITLLHDALIPLNHFRLLVSFLWTSSVVLCRNCTHFDRYSSLESILWISVLVATINSLRDYNELIIKVSQIMINKCWQTKTLPCIVSKSKEL